MRLWRWEREQQGRTDDARGRPYCQKGELINTVKGQEFRHTCQQRGDRHGDNSSGHEHPRTRPESTKGHQGSH
jgi:hypothetical protein